MGDGNPLTDGTLGEHIRFPKEVALIIQHLQRGQEAKGVVRAKHGFVCAGVDDAVFLHEGIVQLVQALLFSLNRRIRVIFRLILNQLADTVADANHTLDAVCCRDG